MAVGEAPGKNEDVEGKPFVGASGELLNHMLGLASLHRSDLFITNVAHVRPPDNDFDWFLKPKPRIELLQGVLQLQKDLQEIKPNLVIALGDVPLQFLTGKRGIGKWRGSILECSLVKGLKVIATYHPASAFRVYENKAIIEVDLRRCAEECKSPEIRLPERTFYIDPPRDLLESLVGELEQAEWLSTDIECFKRPDGSWQVSCVGFSDRPDRALVVRYDSPEKRAAVARLCRSGAKKIFQNGQFDIAVLADNGVEINFAHAWDTMYGHHALYPECAGAEDEVKKLTGSKGGKTSPFGKGLGFQTSIYTREPYYKDDGKLWETVQ